VEGGERELYREQLVHFDSPIHAAKRRGVEFSLHLCICASVHLYFFLLADGSTIFRTEKEEMAGENGRMS